MTNNNAYMEMQQAMRDANEELMKALGDIGRLMADNTEGEQGKVRKAGLFERFIEKVKGQKSGR